MLAPLREFGPPGLDLVGPMPYVAVQQLLDRGEPEGHAQLLDGRLPRRAARRGDRRAGRAGDAAGLAVQPDASLVPGGGAIARVAEDATAFGQRTAPWNIHYLSMWEDPADDDAQHRVHRARSPAAMKPWTTGRVYLNFIGDEGLHRVEAAFGEKKYARLQALKAEWDPDNVFRHNQNIQPASERRRSGACAIERAVLGRGGRRWRA